MPRRAAIFAILACLWACSGGGEPAQVPSASLPPARRFAPYEHKLDLPVAAGAGLKGSVPVKFELADDGRLLGLPMSAAGMYVFQTGGTVCALKIVEQPHALPDLPVARDYACACALDGKLYVFGGRADFAEFTAFAHRYDPKTRQWEELPSIPHPRQRAAAAALHGSIYLIGGYCGEESVLVHSFDPAANQWREAGRLSEARYAACAASAQGAVYCIGGWVSCRHEVSDG
jgi:hypothetical protein